MRSSVEQMKENKLKKNIRGIKKLLFESGPAVRMVNLITLYRIVTFPILIFFALAGHMDVFKWLLLASFFTDAIDGFVARKYKATSVLGAKLDSIGDDLTILAAAMGLFLNYFDFIKEEAVIFIVLFTLFLIQLVSALNRYKKISTFHTYLAKIAAVVTGIFLLSVFFTEEIVYPLFYTAAIITGLELMEEIILVRIIPKSKANVKGLYWVMTKKV